MTEREIITQMMKSFEWIIEYCDELRDDNADFGTIADYAARAIEKAESELAG